MQGTVLVFQNRSITHGHYQNLGQDQIPDQNKITALVSFVGLLVGLLVTAISKITHLNDFLYRWVINPLLINI